MSTNSTMLEQIDISRTIDLITDLVDSIRRNPKFFENLPQIRMTKFQHPKHGETIVSLITDTFSNRYSGQSGYSVTLQVEIGKAKSSQWIATGAIDQVISQLSEKLIFSEGIDSTLREVYYGLLGYP
jgi:hypothetical protein